MFVSFAWPLLSLFFLLVVYIKQLCKYVCMCVGVCVVCYAKYTISYFSLSITSCGYHIYPFSAMMFEEMKSKSGHRIVTLVAWVHPTFRHLVR